MSCIIIYNGQSCAAIESRLPDGGDGGGNGDGGESCAARESRALDGGDSIGDVIVGDGTVNNKCSTYVATMNFNIMSAGEDGIIEGVSAGGDGGEAVGGFRGLGD